MKTGWKRLILIWDNASYHVSQIVLNYINAQKDWLTIIHLPKKAPYLNPNERRVNQQIKSDVCANRFYDQTEKLNDAVSEYLDTRFRRWYYDIIAVVYNSHVLEVWRTNKPHVFQGWDGFVLHSKTEEAICMLNI
ncbi:MAG: transposase [Candidatus Nitrosopolaris sp.]